MSITDPRYLGHDPLTGAVEYFYSDAEGKEFTIVRTEDVEPLVEFNKAVVNKDHGRWGDGKVVAQFPMSIWWENQKRGVWDAQKACKRWHNDPSNRVFRVRPGRV